MSRHTRREYQNKVLDAILRFCEKLDESDKEIETVLLGMNHILAVEELSKSSWYNFSIPIWLSSNFSIDYIKNKGNFRIHVEQVREEIEERRREEKKQEIDEEVGDVELPQGEPF